VNNKSVQKEITIQRTTNQFKRKARYGEQQIDSKIHHNTANNKSEHCKYNHTHVRVTYSTQPFLLCKKKCCTHTNGPPLLFFFTHHSHKTHSHIYTHTISYCDTTIVQYPFNESRREVSPCIYYMHAQCMSCVHVYLCVCNKYIQK